MPPRIRADTLENGLAAIRHHKRFTSDAAGTTKIPISHAGSAKSYIEEQVRFAILQKDTVKLRQLIRKGYGPNKHDVSRCKILHVAATLGLVSTVELLLEAGAEIDAEAGSSFTALGAAIMYRREDVATMLIRRGARTTAIGG